MRRRLAPILPALTRFYGLRPWEVEQLTWGEVEMYVAAWRDAQRSEGAE